MRSIDRSAIRPLTTTSTRTLTPTLTLTRILTRTLTLTLTLALALALCAASVEKAIGPLSLIGDVTLTGVDTPAKIATIKQLAQKRWCR